MKFEKVEGSHLPADYDRKWITICVLVQFFANLFINVDMGILPAGSTLIKQELQIQNSDFGALGSMVYVGQTIGSALATSFFAKQNPKLILGTCLALNIGTLVLFTVT